MKWLAALHFGLATTSAALFAVAKPPYRALELSVQAGYGHVFGGDVDRSFELQSTNGGSTIASAIAYRTPYLFVPWAEFGWAALQSSREAPKSIEFQDESPSESSLSTSYLLVGPSVEAGPLRYRAGIGLYRLQVTSSFAGRTITPSSWDMGYFLAYGVRAYDGARYGWGIEAEALLMSESQLAYFGICLRVWGNVWAKSGETN